MILGAPDRLADAGIVAETGAGGRRPAVEVRPLGRGAGVVLEAAQADQLELARAETEREVARHIEGVAVELLRGAPIVGVAVVEAALEIAEAIPIGVVDQAEIGLDRTLAAVIEHGGQARVVELVVHHLVAPLGHHAGRVCDHIVGAADGTAPAVVLHRQGVAEIAQRAGIGDRAPRQTGLGVVLPHGGLPLEIATGLGVGLEDHIGDLASEARDAQGGGRHDLDPRHVGGRHVLQPGHRVGRLVGHAFAVDQDILRRLAEAAVDGARDLQREAGDLDQHVVSGLGLVAREVGRGKDQRLGLGRRRGLGEQR